MRVKIYSFFVEAAERRDVAAALSVWTLARAIDERGSGKVALGDLRAAARAVWSKVKTWSSIRAAERLGLITIAAGDVYFPSPTNAALRLGVQTPTKEAIEVEASALKSVCTLRAAIWVAFQSGKDGKTISRKRLEEETGICRRTQLRRERRANKLFSGKILKQKNALGLGAPATEANLRMYRLMEHPGCYSVGGEIVRPLPNTYTSTHKRVGKRAAEKAYRRICSEKREIGERVHPKTFFPDRETARKYVRKQQIALSRKKRLDLPPTEAAFYPVGKSGKLTLHRRLA